MSLLMQALKKAEHAKQKQIESPSTNVADDKNPLTIQNDDITLSPQVTEQASPAVDLDTLGMELSPVVDKAEPGYAEPARPEPAYQQAEPAANFDQPLSEKSVFETDYNAQNKQNHSTEYERFERDARSNTEAVSQQLTAKMRLEQQKAAALEAGKIQAEQQKAKAVFASKQPKGNRRTLWIALAGLLIVALFFGGGYYYLQMNQQGSTMLVKSMPIQTAPTQVAVALPAPAPEAAAAMVPQTDAVPAATAVQAAPPQKNVVQSAPEPARQAERTAPARRANSEPEPVQRKAKSTTGAEAIDIRQTTIDSRVNPAVTKAYQAFMNGDLAAAQQQYQIALQQEPNNRDALLGMAAIAISRRQGAQAGSAYLKLLELDPSDPDAIAGITSLQGGDPSEIESRLKRVLTQNPQAGAILFVLGNMYAQQSRWPEAQQAYFRAYGAAPANPDYAFNLAVSLDRLNQEKLALEFYQRALTLAQNKPGNFNKTAIQNRVQQLQSNLETR